FPLLFGHGSREPQYLPVAFTPSKNYNKFWVKFTQLWLKFLGFKFKLKSEDSINHPGTLCDRVKLI
ncbi:MAG TPA: hypothetical protein V6D27_04800, partial [Vampirovibrionales bacterium]